MKHGVVWLFYITFIVHITMAILMSTKSGWKSDVTTGDQLNLVQLCYIMLNLIIYELTFKHFMLLMYRRDLGTEILLFWSDPSVWVIKPQCIDFLLEYVQYLVPRERRDWVLDIINKCGLCTGTDWLIVIWQVRSIHLKRSGRHKKYVGKMYQ